jgi:putative sigma-54 modulation protein
VNVIVKARHMEVSDAMRDYVESKAAKLPRYYDNIQSIEAILDMEADQAVVEIVVTARRKATFVATHREEDMYASVDQCLRKITEQLRRHKDKVRDRQSSPLSQSAGAGRE